MANFDSIFFGLVFPGFQATQKIHDSRPKFMSRIVGIPLQFHFLEPKIYSRRFSAYGGVQKIHPSLRNPGKTNFVSGVSRLPADMSWTLGDVQKGFAQKKRMSMFRLASSSGLYRGPRPGIFRLRMGPNPATKPKFATPKKNNEITNLAGGPYAAFLLKNPQIGDSETLSSRSWGFLTPVQGRRIRKFRAPKLGKKKLHPPFKKVSVRPKGIAERKRICGFVMHFIADTDTAENCFGITLSLQCFLFHSRYEYK